MTLILSYLKTAFNLVRWLSWLSRKLGLSDFGIYLTLFFVVIVASTLDLVLSLECVRTWLEGRKVTSPNLQSTVPLLTLGACIVQFLYVLRLRKVGIASLDSEITKGTDYKSALKLINDGFDFVGIGASKLTQNRQEIETALENIKSHGKVARLLLCDPRSPIVTQLEQLANVSSGQYLLNVKQSFAVLETLKKRFGNSLEIRVYQPKTDDDLITLRLMFINGNLCLLSQNEVGTRSKEGRSASQLHIVKGSLIGDRATLYATFTKLFNQLWTARTSTPITQSDFSEIANLKAS